jgi:hypothetical protein
VVDHLTSDWKILQSTHKYIKKDASTIEVPVCEVKVDYTVRTKWD